MNGKTSFLAGVVAGCVLTMGSTLAWTRIHSTPGNPTESQVKDRVRAVVHRKIEDSLNRYRQGREMDLRTEIPKDQCLHSFNLYMRLLEDALPGAVTRELRGIVKIDDDVSK